MARIIIDLPQTLICSSDIEIQPVGKDIINQPSQSARVCLSLIVLFFPYAYLLYQHVSSLWELHTKHLIHQLDWLDLWIILVSVLRLAAIFFFPMINHGSGLIALGVLAFLWEIGLLMIYLKFVIENKRNWMITFGVALVAYLVIVIYLNYSRHEMADDDYKHGGTIIPIFFPQMIIDLIIAFIAVYEFLYIQKAMAERLLTPNIVIELKNRRSFIFLTVTTVWVSLFMRKYPDIFQPMVGVVLYFVISEWLNMAIIYRCILHRIIRSNDDSSTDGEEIANNKRNSNLIVIEMQDYSGRK